MKIRITTNRQPWVDRAPRDKGEELDVSDEDAKILIDAGFAEALEATAAPRRRREIAE